MYRHSPITIRLFLMLLVLISIIFTSIYLFTVPRIKENVYKIELSSNRQVLNIVYDLADRIQADTETYVDNVLKSNEQRLRSVVDIAQNHIEATLKQGKLEGKSNEQLWEQIFNDLRKFEFGNEDYLWIADYDSVLLSHPVDEFYQRNMSDYPDIDGKLIVPNMVAIARDKGQGFYKYKWTRLNNPEVIDKFSYFKDFPDWNFVIGAGVYIDDIEEQVNAQKQQAVLEIHKALQDIRIAGSGYLYIFDSQGNMLSHPNPNIHGKNFKTQLNPVTLEPIYLDLIEVTDTDSELYYKWDRPDDPGNYSYEKLSLVRHLKGFDWYISSSVYLDDLKVSSYQLSRRIIVMGIIGLLGAILVTFFFAKWLTSPIRKLSNAAEQVSIGNLSAKTGIERNDELGVLAESFDFMVDSIRDNVSTLNDKVKSRTKELLESNAQLMSAVQSLKKTQTELQAVEARQRMILDALPAQVAYIDHQERYVFANRDYLNMFSPGNESIEGKHLVDVIGEDMYHETHPYIEKALNGSQSVYEYRLHIDGEEIITRRTVLPFYGHDRAVVGMLVLSIDITSEKEAEERLAEASKMQAIGQMSGGLAHDFNNLLTIILGNLLEIEQNNSTLRNENLQHNLTPAIKATRRGADITKRLLAFSRQQPLTPARIKPGLLISELTNLLKVPLPDNILLTTQIAQNIPDVYVDAAQMEDALVNLVLNATDAMPSGGEVCLAVSEINFLNSITETDTYDEKVAPGRYAMISVIDQGEGFTDEALEKAFEPFFTTKSQGAGSGLGLSMVYGFVKQSKGYIRIQNNDQLGSRIDILLPKTDKQVDREKPATNETTPQVDSDKAGSLVILVEDNQDVRSVVRTQLTSMGFAVLEAASGDEALGYLDAMETISGIVSDIVMPGKTNGYAFAKAVNQKHPEAFIVLMSGYSDPPPETDFTYSLLPKPFDPDTLARAIHNSETVISQSTTS